MKKTFFAFFLLAAALAGCRPDAGGLRIYQTEPMVKIFHTETAFEDRQDTVFVARGENAVFQFVVQSDEPAYGLSAEIRGLELGKKDVGWIHDVISFNHPKSPDAMIPEDNLYPDPIIDDMEEDIEEASGHKTLWVDINVPRDVKPGLYRGKLAVTASSSEGKRSKASKEFFIKVYDVTLPEKMSLKVELHPGGLAEMNGGVEPEVYSDRWRELFGQVAGMAAEYEQNCWLVSRPGIVLNADGSDFDLDFTAFDEFLSFLQEKGNMQYFSTAHLGHRRQGEWEGPFVFDAVLVEGKELKTVELDYDDPRLEKFLRRYIGLYAKHLEENGWIDKCYFHIADEPLELGTVNQKSWSHVAAIVKDVDPRIRTFDACFEIIPSQDVSVVLLAGDIGELPPVPDGCERWMYTCCNPQGAFANRFVAQPLLKTRILHWINYRYNAVGYLHWGLTRWNYCKDPLHCVSSDEFTWPGGDSHILFPGDGRVYPGIRACAMRDGIRDYELLKMVEAKDSAKAMDFCKQLVLGPAEYDMSPEHFNDLHRKILEYLESGND